MLFENLNGRKGAMHTKLIFGLRILVLLALLLFGCTSLMIGNKELKKNNYRAAIPHYLESLSRNPDCWRARGRLGVAYLKTGQLDKSIQEFNKVLKQKPQNPYANLHLGMAWLQEEFPQLIQHPSKSWKGYPNTFLLNDPEASGIGIKNQ